MFEVNQFLLLATRQVLGYLVQEETNRLVSASLVLSVQPLVQLIDSPLNVPLGFFLVIVFARYLTPRLLVMIYCFCNPLTQLPDLHVKVKVNVEDFNQPFHCGFTAMQVNHQSGVGFDNV